MFKSITYLKTLLSEKGNAHNNMKYLLYVVLLIYCSSCNSQTTIVPAKHINAINEFYRYLNEGNYSLDSVRLCKIFYFKSVEERGQVFDSSIYSPFYSIVKEEEKRIGPVNIKRLKIKSVYDVNDKMIKNLGNSIKPDAYQVKYGLKTTYFYIIDNRIHSFQIINFGGQPIFLGVG